MQGHLLIISCTALCYIGIHKMYYLHKGCAITKCKTTLRIFELCNQCATCVCTYQFNFLIPLINMLIWSVYYYVIWYRVSIQLYKTISWFFSALFIICISFWIEMIIPPCYWSKILQNAYLALWLGQRMYVKERSGIMSAVLHNQLFCMWTQISRVFSLEILSTFSWSHSDPVNT